MPKIGSELAVGNGWERIRVGVKVRRRRMVVSWRGGDVLAMFESLDLARYSILDGGRYISDCARFHCNVKRRDGAIFFGWLPRKHTVGCSRSSRYCHMSSWK